MLGLQLIPLFFILIGLVGDFSMDGRVGWISVGLAISAGIHIWWISEMSVDGQEGTNKYGPDPRTTQRT